MSVKPTTDPARLALASDYERALCQPRGVPWADRTCRAMADDVRANGPLLTPERGYTWDRAGDRVQRYPTATTARVGCEAMPTRVHRDRWLSAMVNDREVGT